MAAKKTRLLIVDDIPENRDVLSRRLSLAGFETETAVSGVEALEKIDAEDFDLVLLDIMMPEMNGIEVLDRVRMTRSRTQLPIIMLTALSESEDVVNALSHGANDYIIKPFDIPVMLARIETHVGLKNATAALDAAYQGILRDLQTAAKIQHNLLPSEMPEVPGVKFSWSFKPCTTLAGDLLNVVRFDERYVGLYLFDVSGHGVPAALMASTLNHVMTSLPGNGSIIWDRSNVPGEWHVAPPVEVANRLNQRFPMDNDICQYFTILYGILDLEDFTFRYTTAGHPGPLVVEQDGNASVKRVPGVPIGWIPENPGYEEHVIKCEPGMRVYLFCDGVVEARDGLGKQYGTDRLAGMLSASRDGSLDASVQLLVDDVKAWANGAPQDDVSVLSFEVLNGTP